MDDFVFNGLIIYNNLNNKPALAFSIILTFLVYTSLKDLYWLYLIRKSPKDRMVLCYGYEAIVYRGERSDRYDRKYYGLGGTNCGSVTDIFTFQDH